MPIHFSSKFFKRALPGSAHARMAVLRAVVASTLLFFGMPCICISSQQTAPADLIRNNATASIQSPAYMLGIDDQIVVHAVHAKEIADKQFRIEATGDINFPLIGRVHAAGRTAQELENELAAKLKIYYLEPEVTVVVDQIHSHPASILGAVATPGKHQLQGRTTLLDFLSMAGGIRTDAGPKLRIVRQKAYGPLPVPNAQEASDGSSVADVDLKNLLSSSDPAANIVIQPYDVVTIARADTVYVVGNVKKSGGFPLGDRSSITALELLSLAEGLDIRASAKHTRVLRASNVPGGGRTDTPVDLQKILDGKAPDISLGANDILFVPNSAARSATTRAIETAIQIGTGFVIFHR